MSATIVEANEFTADITVPTGGDTRNAASVLSAFQALANRTKYLKTGRLGVRLISNISFIQAVSGTENPWNVYASGEMRSNSSNGYAYRGLDDLLVQGASFTNVSMRVKPGAARSSGRMGLYVQKCAIFGDGEWSIIGSSGSGFSDDGTTALQTISAAITETVDLSTYSYMIGIRAGTDGDVHADQFYGASITQG
jgi:hypothetical protein